MVLTAGVALVSADALGVVASSSNRSTELNSESVGSSSLAPGGSGLSRSATAGCYCFGFSSGGGKGAVCLGRCSRAANTSGATVEKLLVSPDEICRLYSGDALSKTTRLDSRGFPEGEMAVSLYSVGDVPGSMTMIVSTPCSRIICATSCCCFGAVSSGVTDTAARASSSGRESRRSIFALLAHSASSALF